MKVLAVSAKGKEFLYKPATAHKVSARSGKAIMDALNKARYGLKENEVWHMHDVSPYDNAYAYATYQEFSIYKGNIRERRM